jgi:hypothetical protein
MKEKELKGWKGERQENRYFLLYSPIRALP